MSDNPETTTPSSRVSGQASRAPSTTNSSGRSYGASRSGYRGGYRSRGEQSIISVNLADKDFKGKHENIGVLGLPIEKNLKFGLSFEDFQESLMNYAEANLKKGNDLKPLLKFMIDPIERIGASPALPSDAIGDPEKLQVWKEKLSKYNKRIETIEDNQVKMYGIIFGQCTESLKSEIKGDDEYPDMEMDSNALWLVKMIKKISAGINTKKNEMQAYVNKCREVWNCVQASNETLDAFQKRFRSTAQTAELAGGRMIFLPELRSIKKIDRDDVSAEEYEVLKGKQDKQVKENVLAMLFMQNADKARYGRKYDEIDEASELGRDEFPKTLTQAFDILVMQEHRVIERHNRVRQNENRRGVAFVQGGGRSVIDNSSGNRGGTDTHYANGRPRQCPEGEEPMPGVNGNVMRDYLCFGCNRYGHTRRFCPEAGNNENRNVTLYRGLSFNNFIQNFLLQSNIYLIDCAAFHSTVSSLDHILNRTKF